LAGIILLTGTLWIVLKRAASQEFLDYVREGRGQDDPAQSRRDALEALEIFPLDRRAIVGELLDIDAILHETQGARQAMTVLESIGEHDRRIWEELGQHFYRFGDYPAAEDVFRRLWQETGDHGYRRQIAEVMVWQGEFDNAAREIADLRKHFPDDKGLKRLGEEVALKARLQNARALRLAGHTKDAAAAYRHYMIERKALQQGEP
jgi:tetratricopeptide (TPR) repeat protein